MFQSIDILALLPVNMTQQIITPSAYIWTDINGNIVNQGDLVKSFHNSYSKNSYLVGMITDRREVEICPCGEDHLVILVQTEVMNGVHHRIDDDKQYNAYPSCVSGDLGGAVIELLTHPSQHRY